MIHRYDNATQTRWDRGEFKVQLNLPNNPRPMGFCDGSPEDLADRRRCFRPVCLVGGPGGKGSRTKRAHHPDEVGRPKSP